MAKQLSYKRSTTESITVKGVLNDTADKITYLDEDKDECVIAVQDLLNQFASTGISMVIKSQSDEELEFNADEEADEIDADDLAPDRE